MHAWFTAAPSLMNVQALCVVALLLALAAALRGPEALAALLVRGLDALADALCDFL